MYKTTLNGVFDNGQEFTKWKSVALRCRKGRKNTSPPTPACAKSERETGQHVSVIVMYGWVGGCHRGLLGRREIA